MQLSVTNYELSLGHVESMRGRRSQYERNGASAPLVDGLSGREPFGLHAAVATFQLSERFFEKNLPP
ncbi:MAG: hypothetical protein ACFFB5_01895 [Promethearchaeota archaeon]